MAEYGNGRSTSSKDALSATAMRFIEEYFFLFGAWTIFRHIDFCHKSTIIMSETSENTIFVRFYLTLSCLTDERRVRGHVVTIIKYGIHLLEWNLEKHFSTWQQPASRLSERLGLGLLQPPAQVSQRACSQANLTENYKTKLKAPTQALTLRTGQSKASF